LSFFFLFRKNVRSIAQRTEWISTDNRLLLREEIIFLKEKLYHVYEDLATLFNRNHILQMSIGEQKKQLLGYEKQFKYSIQIIKLIFLSFSSLLVI
jgi:hypothetical protein